MRATRRGRTQEAVRENHLSTFHASRQQEQNGAAAEGIAGTAAPSPAVGARRRAHCPTANVAASAADVANNGAASAADVANGAIQDSDDGAPQPKATRRGRLIVRPRNLQD